MKFDLQRFAGFGPSTWYRTLFYTEDKLEYYYEFTAGDHVNANISETFTENKFRWGGGLISIVHGYINTVQR